MHIVGGAYPNSHLHCEVCTSTIRGWALEEDAKDSQEGLQLEMVAAVAAWGLKQRMKKAERNL